MELQSAKVVRVLAISFFNAYMQPVMQTMNTTIPESNPSHKWGKVSHKPSEKSYSSPINPERRNRRQTWLKL